MLDFLLYPLIDAMVTILAWSFQGPWHLLALIVGVTIILAVTVYGIMRLERHDAAQDAARRRYLRERSMRSDSV